MVHHLADVRCSKATNATINKSRTLPFLYGMELLPLVFCRRVKTVTKQARQMRRQRGSSRRELVVQCVGGYRAPPLLQLSLLRATTMAPTLNRAKRPSTTRSAARTQIVMYADRPGVELEHKRCVRSCLFSTVRDRVAVSVLGTKCHALGVYLLLRVGNRSQTKTHAYASLCTRWR